MRLATPKPKARSRKAQDATAFYNARIATDRQSEILAYILQHTREHRHAPSMREIGIATGIASVNGVRSQLLALQRKRYIDWSPNGSRSLTVRKGVPFLGDVR